MIVLKVFRTELCFDFSFFAAVSLFFLFFGGECSFAAVVACVVHEFAHLIMMWICSVHPEGITFYGAGIKISSDKVQHCSYIQKLMIYSAGCVVNLLMSVIAMLLSDYSFVVVNIIIAIFNLLPLGMLDGAAILDTLIIRFSRSERVDMYRSIAEKAALAMLFLMLILYFGVIDPLAILIPIYFYAINKVGYNGV